MSGNLAMDGFGGNVCFTSAAVATGTTAGTWKTTASLTYTVDGQFRTAKGATDNVAFTAGHSTIPVSSSCIFGLYIDASGNLSTAQGPIVLTADIPNRGLAFPASQPAKAMLGTVRVDTNASTTFVPGTTSLGAAGITATYTNNAGASPTRPLTA